jgi:hypothetical protein
LRRAAEFAPSLPIHPAQEFDGLRLESHFNDVRQPSRPTNANAKEASHLVRCIVSSGRHTRLPLALLTDAAKQGNAIKLKAASGRHSFARAICMRMTGGMGVVGRKISHETASALASSRPSLYDESGESDNNFGGVGIMKARDIMVSHVITVGPELDLKAVANTLAVNCISAVPVVAINGDILGIISEGDLTRRVGCRAQALLVA